MRRNDKHAINIILEVEEAEVEVPSQPLLLRASQKSPRARSQKPNPAVSDPSHQ
jgi:hypothetical protein